VIPDKVKQMVRDTVARMDERLPSPSRIPLPRRVLSTIFEEEAAHIRPAIPLKTVPFPASATTLKRTEAPEGEGYRVAKRTRILKDKLGKFIRLHSKWYQELRWDELVRKIRKRGDLEVRQDGNEDSHPALGLLKTFQRTGVPVVMSTAPWGIKKRTMHVRRGAHQSCKDHLEFIRTEMLDFVEKGYWMVLPYHLVRDDPQLRLSPLGVVPQRERRPRLIVDYTFNGVNKDTVKMMPAEAMQFGRTLERILYAVHHANPHHGPVYVAKTDMADGFYRVPLSTSGIPKLGVILPRFPNEEQLVAFPLVLPMGWVESPPAFCAATETVADLANNIPASSHLPKHPLEDVASTSPEAESPPTVCPATDTVADLANNLTARSHLPKHPLEDVAGTSTDVVPHLTQCDPTRSRSATDDSPPRPVLRPFRRPVALHDIYVDDFLSLIQGSSLRRLRHMRGLLHSVDRVFRPLDDQDSPHRQHVPSIKKFKKGDGSMQTVKNVLGWILDTVRGTLELPPHRRQRLSDIFADVKGQTRMAVSKWHKILGELRSMSIGVPGSKGLFSTLQTALQFTEANRIRITPEMHDQLADFELLANDLGSRPTAIAELVPDHPVAIGPHDASGTGMGGAWFPATTNSNLTPLLWRAKFPESIQNELVSDSNPTGTINNSQLELAGNIAHQDVLAQHVDCSGRTIVPLGDNIAQVAWQHKGSVTTASPTAYLLRLNSLHQRHFRYLAKPDYIPGPLNLMADDLSRLWHLTDSQLLSYFNIKYPQDQPWQTATLRPAMLSSLTSALQKQRVDPASLLNAQPKKMVIGASGSATAKPLVLAPTSKKSQTSFLFSKFLRSDSEKAPSLPPGNPSQLGAWRTTYAPSVRRSPAWGPRTRA
jgi:hypothetical protein